MSSSWIIAYFCLTLVGGLFLFALFNASAKSEAQDRSAAEREERRLRYAVKAADISNDAGLIERLEHSLAEAQDGFATVSATDLEQAILTLRDIDLGPKPL